MNKPAGIKQAVNIRQTVALCIGNAGTLVGELIYVKQGARENTAVAYAPSWPWSASTILTDLPFPPTWT